jgi:hypothetical protein
MAEGRIQWRTLGNTVMMIRVPNSAPYFDEGIKNLEITGVYKMVKAT